MSAAGKFKVNRTEPLPQARDLFGRNETKLSRRHFQRLAAGAAALPIATGSARAQSWPARPVNQETNAGLADSKLKARLADLGGIPIAGSPADFGKLIAVETEKWGKVIRTPTSSSKVRD